MCDDGPCCDYTPEVKTEDVRATKPHTVQVTLLVDSEDTGKAVSKVLGAVAVGGIQVERVSALPYEPEEDRW